MKRIFAVLALIFLSALPAYAQQTSGVSQAILGVDIKAQTTNCTVNAACAWVKLPNVAGSVAVTLAGTFSGTITVEQSGDGGNTWSTLATLTGVGVTSYSVNGMTDVRARCSTYVSGTISTTLSVGLLQVQSVVSGSATGGVGSTAGPVLGFYITNSCPVANTGQCFFTSSDAIQFNDCNWTVGQPTVNCTAPHFVSTDVGKNAMGGQSCVDDNQGSGTGGQINTASAVTIAAFVSATQITLSSNAGATVAANGCFIYGHLDDANFTLLNTAVVAAPTCPKVFLAAANYFVSKPFLFTNPTSCITAGPGGAGALSFGSTTLPAGLELEGRGTLPTTVFLDTSFPNGNACTNKASSSQANGGCFAIPVMGKWSDFRIDGGAQHAAPNLNSKNLITMAVGTLQNFTCTNMGWLGTGQVGINMGVLSQLYQVNNAGCGTTAFQAENNASNVVVFRSVAENSNIGLSIAAGADVSCYYCIWAVQNAAAAFQSVSNNGGTLKMFGGRLLAGNTAGTASVGFCYKDTGAGSFYADAVQIACNAGAAGNGGVWLSAANAKVSLINGTTLQGQAGGFAYADTAGSTLFIDPTVTISQQFSNGPIVGSIIADGHSISGSCTGVSLAAGGTFGLYGTGPNITSTTCGGLTAGTIGSGIVMTASRTLSNLIVTATAAGAAGGSGVVTVMKNGGATTLTCTVGTTTACNDFTHTATTVKGDFISIQFTAGVTDTLAGIKAFTMWQ